MIRWTLRFRPLASTLPLLLLAFVAGNTAAQTRNFPDAALRGRLLVTAPPDVQLDGRADRLSPGVRIRDPNNRFLLTGSLAGQELVVNYLREPGGQIGDVWVLSAEEAAVKRAGAPGRSLFDFLFGS